jgi:hypothetical protein
MHTSGTEAHRPYDHPLPLSIWVWILQTSLQIPTELIVWWYFLSLLQYMEGDSDIIQLVLYGFGLSVVTILLVDVKCFLPIESTKCFSHQDCNNNKLILLWKMMFSRTFPKHLFTINGIQVSIVAHGAQTSPFKRQRTLNNHQCKHRTQFDPLPQFHQWYVRRTQLSNNVIWWFHSLDVASCKTRSPSFDGFYSIEPQSPRAHSHKLLSWLLSTSINQW